MAQAQGRKKPKRNRAGDPNRSLSMDRCQTPPYAVEPLIPYLDPQWVIWESAAGEGLLADTLREHGFQVVETDILTGQNFYQTVRPDGVSATITNPPYSGQHKARWTARCYALEIPFALLMPVEFLGTKGGQSLFRKYGIEVIFLNDRVDFKMPEAGWEGSGAQFPVAWYTHGLNIGQQMTFAIMNKPNKQRRDELAHDVTQHSLFDVTEEMEEFQLGLWEKLFAGEDDS